MNYLQDKKKITEAYFIAINQSNIELYKRIKDNFDVAQPILPVIEFIIERLNTVTSLIQLEKVWDAEIVLRSATEALLKLLFITSAESPEQEERIKEFWNDFAEINRIKQSEQAKTNLKVLEQNEMNTLAFSPIVLSEEEEEILRKKWSKKARRKLEQKWSFSEIVLSLSTGYKGKAINQFKAILHSYRNASHVTHADETGILIIRERSRRNEEERNIADFAHYLRIISDCHTYLVLVAAGTMDFLKLDKSFFIEQVASLSEIQALTDKYILRLYDDEVYDKQKSLT